MSVELTREELERKNKAYNRRYKKAAVRGLTFFEIQTGLEEIISECDEVTYWTDSDEETLVDAMEGDYDEAARFRFDFSDLSADAERMYDDLNEVYDTERYDDILVAAGLGDQRGSGLFGFDEYEGDYMGIERFMYGYAEQESAKRLERLTKKELIAKMAQSVSIAFNYISIRSRYEDLKDSMDLLRAKNREYLDATKRINELYDQIDWTSYGWRHSSEAEELDRIAEKLPQEAFLY